MGILTRSREMGMGFFEIFMEILFGIVTATIKMKGVFVLSCLVRFFNGL